MYSYLPSDLSLSRVQRPKVSALRNQSMQWGKLNREIIDRKEKSKSKAKGERTKKETEMKGREGGEI